MRALRNARAIQPSVGFHSSRYLSSASASVSPSSKTVPSHARVVVIGGGVVGSSIAYNLSKLGWDDIVVLEQNVLTSGTTWHAAGLVGLTRATSAETKLSISGVDMYKQLESETGLSPGYKSCGSLSIARTNDRMTGLYI